MTIRLLFIALTFSCAAFAQDETLTIMHYNLTYYGNTGGSFIECDDVNNNVLDKNNYLRTIIGEALPDVFAVNELGNNVNYVDGIRDNVLNTNGRDYYANAQMNGSSDIINMLYYNTNKLTLYSEDVIMRNLDNSFITRHIDVHTLYYNDPDLANGADTVFLTFIVAHLKAGSDAQDQVERDQATAAVMNHIKNNPPRGYMFFMGDLNSRSSSEPAIQNLVDYEASNFNFVDPVNQLGNWQSSFYADLHTQSTRSNNNNGGCFASGGMDDRFDMILMSHRMQYAGAKVQYINGTYKALGQDGNAYNSDLNISNNGVVSSAVAQALYNMSDHLPVMMDIGIYPDNSGITGEKEIKEEWVTVRHATPVRDVLTIQTENNVEVRITDLAGQLVMTEQVQGAQQMSVAHLQNGVYLMQIEGPQGEIYTEKWVKAF